MENWKSLVLLTSKGKSYYCNIAGILASEELSAAVQSRYESLSECPAEVLLMTFERLNTCFPF